MEAEKNNKKLKLGILCFGILLVCGGLYLFIKKSNENKEKLNVKVFESTTSAISNNWKSTSQLEVDSGDKTGLSYSFDGGESWQTSNKYTVSKNGKVVVVVKDSSNNISDPITYEVKNIDNTKPIININLPSSVYVGDSIVLKDYVTAIDNESGIKGEITITPNALDTSIVGEKKVAYSVMDNAGNQTTIDAKILVVEVSKESVKELSNVTLYRYRVKETVNYKCNVRDCSFLDDSQTASLINGKIIDTGKCNPDYNVIVTIPDGCGGFIPYIPGPYGCTYAIEEKPRYFRIDNDVAYTVDYVALLKNGLQSPTYIKRNDVESPETFFKTAPCGENEYNVDNYCHAICSYKTTACPDNYLEEDGICKKIVKKECSDSCSSFSWSNWSNWSKTKIVANENTEVETKYTKE